MAGKILVAEDDSATAHYVVSGLKELGHNVDHVDNGREALFLATDGSYDAVVLDRMLPGMEGMAVLQALRAAQIDVPVLILSALGSVDDRVAGLTAGSDDYLVKPFAFAELSARLDRLLMRRRQAGMEVQTRMTCADLSLDMLSREVRRGSRQIELQPREYRLLEFLLRHQGQVVTRTMLLEGVWDYHFDPMTNVIDVHISRLRRKIDQEDETPLIHTVRGAGYRMGAAG
ncbi:response regulator transcription factor [Sphingobium sufflavum]|uniref:winged helix-turn-helix domain-containing protein n=1 Tax=Sphingobium sufflavum TaxID=1129547 RepID=UPI001F22B5B5|nr:response regulator transcription factor [Sphingobium sufflavum]MCE7795400.1 response regulator transcription factor [Sphingobium sufflavum]